MVAAFARKAIAIEGHDLAWASPAELRRETAISTTRIEETLKHLRELVPHWYVAAGGLWPDGSECKSGGVVYDVSEVVALDAALGARGMILGAFNQALGAEFDDELGVSSVARGTYAMVLLHADEQGRCYASISRLARFFGASARSVNVGLVELEAAGLIRSEQLRPGDRFPKNKKHPKGAPVVLGGAIRHVLPRKPPLARCIGSEGSSPADVVGGSRGDPCPPSPTAFELSQEISSQTEERRLTRDAEERRVIAYWRATWSLRFESMDWLKIVRARLREGLSSDELCATVDAAANKNTSNERALWLQGRERKGNGDMSRMTFSNVLGTLERVTQLGGVKHRIASSPRKVQAPKGPAEPIISRADVVENMKRARVALGFMRATDYVLGDKP